MNVWIVEYEVEYEGSEVIAVLDHEPSQQEMESFKTYSIDGKIFARYNGFDAHYNVSKWKINERL